ncbi:hypothetical protein ABBQ32_011200 [Trebouxia sp. C0010 RCD-2024]
MAKGLFKRGLDDPDVSSALAGGLAGALTAVFVCPLDVLKTRLQVQGRAQAAAYKGIGGGLSMIARQEGIRGLYRGLTPTLVALLPNWAVYFTLYEQLKTSLSYRARDHDWIKQPAIHMGAACGAGAATLAFGNPLFVVKTRLQTQHMGLRMGTRAGGPLYKGTFDALTRIAREEGVAGLYSGLLPSLIGIAHVAIQFPLYEACKSWFAQRALQTRDSSTLNTLELVTASAVSKMIASTATYPHEVLRSHMHVTGSGAFNGFLLVAKEIWQADGLKGFYKGCGTNLLRTTPAAALTFTSFELIQRQLRYYAQENRELKAAESPVT